ncbi:hypothetical protein KR222_010401 [Zaprionus bogoriensis]|nr:hypothetical protein KR222_010401 [Zaprionus bogoriensis]
MELQPVQRNCLQVQLALLSLLSLLLPSAVQSQGYYHYAHHPHRHAHPHPHALYYDAAPRLRRFEYLPLATPYVGAYVAPPATHYQQQTPNFQLINYRQTYPAHALDYPQQQQQQQQQQQPQQQQSPAAAPAVAAPQLPSIYPQSSVQYQQRAAPQAELAKYRYEGNYIPPIQQRVSLAPQLPSLPQRRIEHVPLYNVPPALFTSDVLHVVPSRAAAVHHQQQQHLQQLQQQQQQQQHFQQQQQQQAPQTERPRRDAAHAADTLAAESQRVPRKQSKYFHDIFMRIDGANARSQGHVLAHPEAQERRFESQRGTNRYKGEVIWTDRRGAHGEHRWDMAQGKL